MSAPVPFSLRLRARKELWATRGSWKGILPALHRAREVRAVRTRHDSDEVWHCCSMWQRMLTNKWNSREFTMKHRCQVPELYWSGVSLANAPLESFPPHFVIRGVSGTSRQRVVVMANGVDVLRDQAFTPDALRRHFHAFRRFGPRVQVLVEEFVKSEDQQFVLPMEYKCHTFAGTVGAVQVVRRVSAMTAAHRYYMPDWTPFSDPMGMGLPQDALREPPRCLADLLKTAAVLGKAFGSYVRIDLFATDRGAVLNELGLMPTNGRKFTPYCDDLFGSLWEQHCSTLP